MIQLAVKNVVGDYEERIKIVGWKGILSREQAPLSYLDMHPNFYLCNAGERKYLIIRSKEEIEFYTAKGNYATTHDTNIAIGDSLTKDNFKKLIDILSESADNLRKAKQENKAKIEIVTTI